MRLEQSPENPHMHLAIWCNNNFKHLNVIIMMRMTCASFMQFYENVDMIRYEAFVIVAETKGVPRQRIRK